MRRIATLAVAVGVMLAATLPAAGAVEIVEGPAEPTGGPGLAWFEGRQIDLRDGWGAATACMVWRERGVVECFRSAAAMALREAELSAGSTATGGSDSVSTASYSCSSPLRLYEHGSYGGRQLSFWDRGFWQNLGDWGFNDQLSSFKIGSCYAYLAEHSWGGGEWYPGDTSPWVWSPTMWSGWNDRVSSIYNA